MNLDQSRSQSSVPLETRALGAPFHACAINTIDADCALRCETGCAEFGYFLCYFKMDAPRALVFRPLVKGNEALGTRLMNLDKNGAKSLTCAGLDEAPLSHRKCI